jgi:hypothetical protein
LNNGFNRGLGSSFNRSKLVRLLTELADADAGAGAGANIAVASASKYSFAEKLGLWLDWPDAISLAAVLNKAAAANGLNDQAAALAAAHAAFNEYARVAADLTQALVLAAGLATDQALLQRPTPGVDAGVATLLEFAAYRRSYLAQQQLMAAAIGPLRGQVRAALAGLSPALGQLAALDAVLDEALQARQRHLLAKLPGMLEKHVEHLRRAPPAGLDQGQGACQEMQGLLLAELALRLQPVEGMMEAMADELTRRQ